MVGLVGCSNCLRAFEFTGLLWVHVWVLLAFWGREGLSPLVLLWLGSSSFRLLSVWHVCGEGSGGWSHPFPRFASVGGAGSGVVTESPAFSTLIRKTGVQNSLCYQVIGLGSSPILLAIMVSALVFQNCSCKSGNCTLIAWVSWASAPWELASKFGIYREKERHKPLQSTAVRHLVALAPSSSSNKISKYPLVRRAIKTRGPGRCNLRQSSSVLKVALPPRVLPITVLLAFLVAFSCIMSTNSFGKSALISKL